MRSPLKSWAVSLIVAACGAAPAAAQNAFPGADWQQATPQSQGVDPVKLQEATTYLEGFGNADQSIVVIRNGYLISKSSNIDNFHQVWSCTKSFTSTVLGLLIDDGRCTLDTPAKDHLAVLASNYPDVRLRHFTTMTSGYQAAVELGGTSGGQSATWWEPGTPRFAPGTRFEYWDSAMNQFGHVLTRVAGEPIEALFKRRIADPIGMTGWDWRDWAGWAGFNDGSVNGGSGNWSAGIWLTARQMARFGHLFLNRGNWAGQQLISASWVDQATSPQVAQNLPRGASSTDLNGPGNYGFNWWTSGVRSDGSRMWPAAPNGTYAAGGLNVNVCFVIPEWNMVIVRQGTSWRGDQIDPVLSTFLGKVGAALGTAPPPTDAVTSFTLVNADTDQDLGVLADGAVIDLTTLPTRNLNVRANTSPSPVGSVRFVLDGNAAIENAAPYALAGDAGGNYNPWTPTVTSHILTATPYSGAGATGAAGNSLTVHFTVTDSASSYRIGLSHDGNQHDSDDILSIAMGLAVIVESGLAPRLVHCDYNNHLGDNNPSMAAEMAASANGAAQRWGIPSSVLFDCQQNLTGAVNSIRDAINASSSANRFYLVCAVRWRWPGAASTRPTPPRGNTARRSRTACGTTSMPTLRR